MKLGHGGTLIPWLTENWLKRGKSSAVDPAGAIDHAAGDTLARRRISRTCAGAIYYAINKPLGQLV